VELKELTVVVPWDSLLIMRLNRSIQQDLVLIIGILLFCATWAQWQSYDNSAGTPRLVSGVAERFEHREDRSEAAPVSPVGDFAVTAAFAYSFVKFDRKQNTRLWPFVTTGTTRSPPFVP
jgi:hypothetical protein